MQPQLKYNKTLTFQDYRLFQQYIDQDDFISCAPLLILSQVVYNGCVYHLSQVSNTFQYPLSKRVKTKERRF